MNSRAVPYVTSAHKATKWSKHVVFCNSLWRNAMHFRAYMKRLKDRVSVSDKLVAEYVDMQVYGRFRCMRMNRSSKLKEPGRSLLRIDEQGTLLETATSPIVQANLISSMITVIPLPQSRAGQEAICVTTVLLDRFPDMIAKLGLAPLESPDVSVSRLVASHISDSTTPIEDDEEASARVISPVDRDFKMGFRLHFAHYKPYLFRWIDRECLVRVECDSRQCVILGDAHGSNHVYIEIDILRCLWRHGCHSERCRRTPTEWRETPENLSRLCRTFNTRWRYNARFAALARLAD